MFLDDRQTKIDSFKCISENLQDFDTLMTYENYSKSFLQSIPVYLNKFNSHKMQMNGFNWNSIESIIHE